MKRREESKVRGYKERSVLQHYKMFLNTESTNLLRFSEDEGQSGHVCQCGRFSGHSISDDSGSLGEQPASEGETDFISLSLSLSLSLLLSLSPTLPHPAVACGKGGPQIVAVFFQLLPFSLQFCLSCRRGQKVTNNILLEVLAHLPKGRYMYIHTYIQYRCI